ncbi:hypothetical protein KOXY103107_16340 [Komagataeibacter xylinus]
MPTTRSAGPDALYIHFNRRQSNISQLNMISGHPGRRDATDYGVAG